MTFYDYAEILIQFLQSVIVYGFLINFLRQDLKSSLIRSAIFSAVQAGSYAVLILGFHLNTMWQLVCYLIAILVILINAKSNKLRGFVFMVIGILGSGLLELPFDIMFIRTYPDASIIQDVTLPYRIIIQTISMPLFFVAWWVTYIVVNKIFRTRAVMGLNRYLPFIIVETISIELFWGFSTRSVFDRVSATAIVLLLAVSYIILDILLVRTIQKANKANENELLRLQAEELVRDQSRAYNSFMENMQTVRQLRHDMSNELTAISILLDNNRYEDARNLFSAYKDQVDRVGKQNFTGNSVVDAVVYSKYATMNSNGIDFKCSGVIPSDLNAEPNVLCSIFSNILDNSIHGAMQTGDAEKQISLSVGFHDNRLLVKCVNTCLKDLSIPSALPIATAEHGWGLNILQKITDSHNGTMDYSAENGQFTMQLSISISQEAPNV